MKKIFIVRIVLTIIYLALLILFCYMSCQSGSSSSGLSLDITKFISKILKAIHINIKEESLHHLVRKLIGHFGYFMLIGIVSSLLFYSFKNPKLIWLIMLNLSLHFLFASFTEFVLEELASNRGPSFVDVLIDYSGFLLSAVIITIIYLMKNKNNDIKSE